ncbi:MAG TPA: hypothetical protein VD966_02190 [Pyrinomonadaceae bacterium]|nr:hypothetical protein [Pyrinomonadaceae bacterium]
MKLSQARITILILIMLATTSGCGVINRIRAKNELNEAARAYKAGRFAEAEEHSKRALELDPEQRTAPFFVARTIHAQYKPGVDTPQNVEKARQAIEAYKKLLAEDPNNEEAYKAIAALYGALKEDKLQREWIMQRASSESAPVEKRAEAFTVLASKEWDCSYKITELPDSKQTVMKEGKALIVYKKPSNQQDLEEAKQCIARGMEFANRAISLDPNNESAWSYKTNLLLESAKIAEMEGNAEQKAQYTKEAEEAQQQTKRLSEENQRRKEEAAKKAPPPPAS